MARGGFNIWHEPQSDDGLCSKCTEQLEAQQKVYAGTGAGGAM